MSTSKRHLKTHPLFFFDEIEDKYLDILDECSKEEHFKLGDCVFRAGDAADSFYVIQAGEVSVELKNDSRGDITIQTVSTGEVLGFSWMMEPYQYRFDARVTEPTMTRSYDAKALRDLIDRDRSFGYEIMRRFSIVISQRLQASRLQILEMDGEFSLGDV